jgi:hypothetical protein
MLRRAVSGRPRRPPHRPDLRADRAATPVRPGAQAAAQVYFPARLDWQKKKPEEVGMDAAMIAEAVKIAIAAEAHVFRWIAGDGTNNSVERIIASLKAPAKTTTSLARGQ